MIDGILIVLSVLSAAYFLVISIYSGIGTSFSFIWLFFCALFLFLSYGRWYYARNIDRIPRWVPVSVVTTCIAGLVIFVVVCILVFSGVAGKDPEGVDYVIVLGARVKEHAVSDSLKKRLDKAIEYSEKNPDTILVLSGGKGKDEPISEAEAMYRYLVYNGVNPDRLLLEERSTSTVENIAFSKVVIERHRAAEKPVPVRPPRNMGPEGAQMVEDKPLEIGVLTSNFHVFRAVMIARHWGMENVYGIAARSDRVLFVHMCVRECASILKDRLMGNM